MAMREGRDNNGCKVAGEASGVVPPCFSAKVAWSRGTYGRRGAADLATAGLKPSDYTADANGHITDDARADDARE